MSRYKNTNIYKQAIVDAKEYIDNDFLGFISYLGNSSSNKVYPAQFNFQNSLLLQLAEKLSKVEEKIEKFTEDLNTHQPTKQIIKKSIWKYW